MKKYFIIFLFFSVVLSACQRNTYTFMEFEQAKKIFYTQVGDLWTSLEKLGLDWSLNTHTSLNIQWENKDFKLNSNINISGFVDYKNSLQDLYSQFYLYFGDKNLKTQTQISGYLGYKMIDNNQFINLQNLDVNLWSGNFQNNLILLISKQLENKWLFLKQQDKNKQSLYKDISFLIQSIFSTDFFYSIDTVRYDSLLAYKVYIRPDILEYINQNINFKIKSFDWLLIVQSDSKVALKINNLDIFYDNEFNIKWDVGGQHGSLNIKNMQKKDTYLNFCWDFYKNQYSFIIKQILNYQEIIKLTLNFVNKTSNNIVKNHIYGEVKLYPQLIYWTDLEKEIKIDINGEQKIKIQTGYVTQYPSSYVFLNQVLWDEFSLSNIMEWKDIFKTINHN